jgi:cell division protein FtsQ
MSRNGTRRSTILKRRSAGTERLIVFVKRFGLILLVMIGVFWVGSWFVLSGASARTAQAIDSAILDKTSEWGFSVRNIMVDGRQRTDVDTMRAMLNIERGDPIFSFKPAQAKAMLEKMSWVKTAHVERRLPDTIYIKLTERKPFALWQRNKKLALVDAQGVVLTTENLKEFKNLIILVGDDAPKLAPTLLSMLHAEPLIEERVEAATLIGGRRWDLKLKSGATIKLPEKELGLALRKLATNHEEDGILDKNVISIDVREGDRITVRTKPGAASDFNAVTPATGNPI